MNTMHGHRTPRYEPHSCGRPAGRNRRPAPRRRFLRWSRPIASRSISRGRPSISTETFIAAPRGGRFRAIGCASRRRAFRRARRRAWNEGGHQGRDGLQIRRGIEGLAARQEFVDEAGVQPACAKLFVFQNLTEKCDVGVDAGHIVFAQSAQHAGNGVWRACRSTRPAWRAADRSRWARSSLHRRSHPGECPAPADASGA